MYSAIQKGTEKGKQLMCEADANAKGPLSTPYSIAHLLIRSDKIHPTTADAGVLRGAHKLHTFLKADSCSWRSLLKTNNFQILIELHMSGDMRSAHLFEGGLLFLAQLDLSLRIAQLGFQLGCPLPRGRQLLFTAGLPLRQPQQRRLLPGHI